MAAGPDPAGCSFIPPLAVHARLIVRLSATEPPGNLQYAIVSAMTNAVVAVTLSRWATLKGRPRYLLHPDACPDLHLYSNRWNIHVLIPLTCKAGLFK